MNEQVGVPPVEVRESTAADQPRCEELTRDAFWNVYAPGATEHFIWHTAHQGHQDLVPELSLVATMGADGAETGVVGCVMCTRSRVGEQDHGVIVLGPIAVDPAHQGRGIGTRLLQETLRRAAEAGFAGIVLYGNPAFYTGRGFAPAGRWGLTTPAGETPPVLLGAELRAGALDAIAGPVHESTLFRTGPEEVDAYDARFPAREKQVLPGQL